MDIADIRPRGVIWHPTSPLLVVWSAQQIRLYNVQGISLELVYSKPMSGCVSCAFVGDTLIATAGSAVYMIRRPSRSDVAVEIVSLGAPARAIQTLDSDLFAVTSDIPISVEQPLDMLPAARPILQQANSDVIDLRGLNAAATTTSIPSMFQLPKEPSTVVAAVTILKLQADDTTVVVHKQNLPSVLSADHICLDTHSKNTLLLATGSSLLRIPLRDVTADPPLEPISMSLSATARILGLCTHPRGALLCIGEKDATPIAIFTGAMSRFTLSSMVVSTERGASAEPAAAISEEVQRNIASTQSWASSLMSSPGLPASHARITPANAPLIQRIQNLEQTTAEMSAKLTRMERLCEKIAKALGIDDI
eukprot:TRINITY_DN6146_c0_g1_i1.p1 TRINITY_DN6146_c0_g1~~TRINITY_DN6146_c0_g1_i1.p1  ORF type:complete len:365 (-),score=71.07 TRINITY_DN6146_c0_g1_i1:324-1418(-)